jgi:hypothetical protein
MALCDPPHVLSLRRPDHVCGAADVAGACALSDAATPAAAMPIRITTVALRRIALRFVS